MEAKPRLGIRPLRQHLLNYTSARELPCREVSGGRAGGVRGRAAGALLPQAPHGSLPLAEGSVSGRHFLPEGHPRGRVAALPLAVWRGPAGRCGEQPHGGASRALSSPPAASASSLPLLLLLLSPPPAPSLQPGAQYYGIEENGDQTRDNVSENPPHHLLLRLLGECGAAAVPPPSPSPSPSPSPLPPSLSPAAPTCPPPAFPLSSPQGASRQPPLLPLAPRRGLLHPLPAFHNPPRPSPVTQMRSRGGGGMLAAPRSVCL